MYTVKRKKLHEIKMKKASDKNQIKPFVPYSSKFLNNSGILCSKLIYNLFLVDYSLVKTLDNNFEKSERQTQLLPVLTTILLRTVTEW